LKFNTLTRYGIRTILEIALNESNEGVFQKDIAKNQNISIKYLDRIISTLKAARLITNASGQKSGYKLAKQPSEISLYDIHKAFSSGICVVDCLSPEYVCQSVKKCPVRFYYAELNDQIVGYLEKVTLEMLIKKQKSIGSQIE